MKHILFIISLICCCQIASAQSTIVQRLQRKTATGGTVTVHQDSRIDALLGRSIVSTPTVSTTTGETTTTSNTETATIKSLGYRLQIYAGNNTGHAKAEAYGMAAKVRELFPELTVYTTFISPRWLCKAGDFKNIEEADAMMRKLHATGEFKEVSIVKDQIIITL